MNIKDLANLDINDLKNIDYAAALNSIKKRPDIIVIVICLLVTSFATVARYRSQKKQLRIMSREIRDLRKKTTVIDEYNEARTTLTDLKTVLPQALTESQIMELLTRTARKYNIMLDAFSPATVVDFPSHSTLSITLNMIVSDYTNLWKFIYSIEHAHQALRIDQLSLEIPQKNRKTNVRQWRISQNNSDDHAELDENTLKLGLTISVINFKE